MEPTEEQSGTMRCIHCGQDIMCGQPALGGPCTGQVHVHSNDPACFPRQGPDSPRAQPGHKCSCKVVHLSPSVAPVRPPVPRVIEDPSPARTRNGATRTDNEKLAEVGKAFLGTITPTTEPNVIELADGAGVCVVHPARGGGKVYVAPDETVLFVPSSMHFDTGLSAFLNGARTPVVP